MRNRLRWGIAVTAFAALLGLANMAAAQTAAGIIGQVKDESGAVLPGVTVSVSSPALQVKSMDDVTNAQGDYRITPLPIGTYSITYTLPGFQTVKQEGIRLDIGMQAKIDQSMKIGTLAETVTVSGAAPVVDVTATSASTQFTRDTLELTPTSRNGAISLMVQAPGVRAPGRLDVGGGSVGDTPEFSSFGQPVESYMQMEGIVTSDTRIGSQGGNYFDYNTMEEAKVQTISNGPEVPSRGPALTMILKSGGNEFHGGGEVAYASHRFESNNIDATLKAQGIASGNPLNYRRDEGLDMGGRIVRDKLWFYGAVRYRPQDITQLGGFKPDGSAADAYRGETIINEKFSYQMSQSNKLVYWGQWAQKYHYGESVNQFIDWSTRGNRKPPVRTNTWKAEWQAVKGNAFVFSALFGRWTWTGGSNAYVNTGVAAAETAGVPQGIEMGLSLFPDQLPGQPSLFDQTTTKQTGAPAAGGAWNDIWRYTSKATMSYYKPDFAGGSHDFKVGLETTPTAFIQGNGDRAKSGQYRLVFANGVPTQMELYNYPVIPQNNVSFTSVYGNDSWTVARRLTLDIGGRFEHDAASVPAQGRQAGAWSFTPASKISEVPFQTLNSFAPRVYFSLDVQGNARTVLKGGWGRFYKQRFAEENQMTNPYTAVTASYRWHDLNGNKLYDPGEVDDSPNGPDFISSNAPVSGVTNPNEKPMGTDQFALTLERQLGANFAVRASGVYIHTFNEQRLLNILRPYSAYNIPIVNRDPGPDGVLNNADDPGTNLTYYDYSSALAGRAFEKFQIVNDANSSEVHKAVDLQLIKRISRNWQFLVSYTATKNATVVGHPSNRAANLEPNQEINTGDNTTQKTFRISGLYRLPYGMSVSANFNSESGTPLARQVLVRGGVQIPNITLNATPLGSVTLPTTNVVDVRIDKSFRFKQQRMSMRVNFYNLTNQNTTTSWQVRSGATYLLPTTILRPRIAELGFQYSF